MTQQTLKVSMDKVNKNSLDSHPIHLSFVRHLGTDLQHWIQDSTSPPWRHQNPPWGAGTTPRAAGASLLQNVRNSTLRPWGWATHVPSARDSSAALRAPRPASSSPTHWPCSSCLGWVTRGQPRHCCCSSLSSQKQEGKNTDPAVKIYKSPSYL